MDKVVKLSIKDFDKEGNIINNELNRGITTVMVYANWCGHCQIAKPIFSKLSILTCCQTNCASIDSDLNTKLLSIFNNNKIPVEGFPTFLQFTNGKYKRSFDGSYKNTDIFIKFIMGL